MNKCYLIDKSFFNKIISNDESNILKSYLQKLKYNNLASNDLSSFSNLISHLPKNYIDNIENSFHKPNFISDDNNKTNL